MDGCPCVRVLLCLVVLCRVVLRLVGLCCGRGKWVVVWRCCGLRVMGHGVVVGCGLCLVVALVVGSQSGIVVVVGRGLLCCATWAVISLVVG